MPNRLTRGTTLSILGEWTPLAEPPKSVTVSKPGNKGILNSHARKLTCEIAKPKVWDASALRPKQDRATTTSMEARMASKAHRAKIPQEWTTWNATIGDKPKKGELNSHDPKSTSVIRFETWVVTQAKSSPIRDLSGHSGRIIPRFETWVVTQAKSSPIRDLSGHSGRIIPGLRLGWSPKPIPDSSPILETWVVTQAKSSPIRDLSGHSGRIIPGLRLGWSPKPNHPRFETWVVTQGRFVPRFETWVVTQADSSPIRPRFETWVVTQADLSPNHPQFETWVVTQAKLSPTYLDSRIRTVGSPDLRLGCHSSQINPDVFGLRISRPSDHPICDLTSVKPQIIPDMFGLRISKLSKNTRFETWVVTQAESSLTCLDSGFSNCQTHPNLRLGWSPKPNYPQRMWIQGSEQLDHPI
uniref:Uncharacterized protein n=1 Tax=Fagus sylvatica TaxID=28930 RepID=A0A2N9HP49_FAGSY